MKKTLALIIGFGVIAGTLVVAELTTHNYMPKKDRARELSASIIEQTNKLEQEAEEKKLFTKENIEKAAGAEVKIFDEGMTEFFLDEINTTPLLARKKIIKFEDNEIIINEIDKIKNYPLLLTAGYGQQENGYRMSEISKESFVILSNTDNDKIRFVTQGKDTIIGLLYGRELEAKVNNILKELGYETL